MIQFIKLNVNKVITTIHFNFGLTTANPNFSEMVTGSSKHLNITTLKGFHKIM